MVAKLWEYIKNHWVVYSKGWIEWYVNDIPIELLQLQKDLWEHRRQSVCWAEPEKAALKKWCLSGIIQDGLGII